MNVQKSIVAKAARSASISSESDAGLEVNPKKAASLPFIAVDAAENISLRVVIVQAGRQRDRETFLCFAGAAIRFGRDPRAETTWLL